MFFSKNAAERDKNAICEVLSGVKEQRSSKYLGLPMAIGRSKKQVFDFIKARTIKKIQNWKTKLLNQAGKEVLLKSVALALPVYSMSCFRLPKGICSDISRQIAQFWWRNSEKDKQIHWCSWEKMTTDKAKGGLGFKDLEAFNQALLGKQIWRLLTQPNLLMSRVMKSKYFPKSNVLQASCKPWASWMWKSWQGAVKLIKGGCKWQVGNGFSIKVWEDDWLPTPHQSRILSAKPEGCTVVKVNDLMNQEKEGC